MLYNNSYKKYKKYINNIKHSITTTWALTEIDGNVNKKATVWRL